MAFGSHLINFDLNPNLTRGTSNTTKGSEYFFKKLKAKAKEKADKIVADHAEHMYFILRNRSQMGSGLGRYPKWDGSNGIKSKNSFRNWNREVRPNGNIRLYNTTGTAEDIADSSFSYPLLLLHGEGTSAEWGPKVTLGKGKVNAQGFSTQMPKGIDPWLKKKTDILKEKLKKEFRSL